MTYDTTFCQDINLNPGRVTPCGVMKAPPKCHFCKAQFYSTPITFSMQLDLNFYSGNGSQRNLRTTHFKMAKQNKRQWLLKRMNIQWIVVNAYLYISLNKKSREPMQWWQALTEHTPLLNLHQMLLARE